jgi:hypothetical protein
MLHRDFESEGQFTSRFGNHYVEEFKWKGKEVRNYFFTFCEDESFLALLQPTHHH